MELTCRVVALSLEAGFLEGLTQPESISLCDLHHSCNMTDAQ